MSESFASARSSLRPRGLSEFLGRVAVVTGGASGIGAACSELLAESGARVVIADVNSDLAAEVSAVLCSRGFEVSHCGLDVAEPDECERFFEGVVERYGTLDVAVNAAGIAGPDTPVTSMTTDEWRRVVAVNLSGVFFCLRAELTHMTKARRGAVVNVASILGVVAPSAESGAGYTAAKHGVIGLTRATAVETAKLGVRVNCVAPGYVMTPLLDGLNTSTLDSFRTRHPMDRLGLAAEVAEAVTFLASDRASFITGSTLMVDGGYTAM